MEPSNMGPLNTEAPNMEPSSMEPQTMGPLKVFAVRDIPEIAAGDDLSAVISSASQGLLRDGDILAVTSKIVSKAEGRSIAAEDREDAITSETVRVVATRVHPGGVTRIVENRLGMVAAAAGVDSSNTPPGTVLLLPVDPDASARRLRDGLRRHCGVTVGILITDTLGRAWRQGQTDVAIGAAGLVVLEDLRGTSDSAGRRLDATVVAVADEIAGAADLVKGKTTGCPVAVVRGLARLVTADPADPSLDPASATASDPNPVSSSAPISAPISDPARERVPDPAPVSPARAIPAASPDDDFMDDLRLDDLPLDDVGRGFDDVASGARALVRPAAEDMFRLGTAEAIATGRSMGFDAGYEQGYDAGYSAGLAAGAAAAGAVAAGAGAAVTDGRPNGLAAGAAAAEAMPAAGLAAATGPNATNGRPVKGCSSSTASTP